MCDSDELKFRRNAEIEFVSAAYGTDEAWCGRNSLELPEIHRRLELPCGDDIRLTLILTLTMPPGYPESQGLQISCTLHDKSRDALSARKAYKAIPKLVEFCRGEIIPGEESVLVVLSRAGEWIQDHWTDFWQDSTPEERVPSEGQVGPVGPLGSVMGRRLIYSHHIISKTKRRDLKLLASNYTLTGFLKIGWPGLILIEGADSDCVAFFNEIKTWSWKLLALRGEQQETVREVEPYRKFKTFIETDDVSLVAQSCREVGLEALFMTFMKVYSEVVEEEGSDAVYYGILVHLDHMNQMKGYHKWLRKAAKECGCLLTLKQTYAGDDSSKRPIIIVAAVGESGSIQQLLKRWRTSRVDIDSKGKPCLERRMTILTEGPVHSKFISSLNWDGEQSEQDVNTTIEQLNHLVSSIGGDVWKQSLDSLRVKSKEYL